MHLVHVYTNRINYFCLDNGEVEHNQMQHKGTRNRFLIIIFGGGGMFKPVFPNRSWSRVSDKQNGLKSLWLLWRYMSHFHLIPRVGGGLILSLTVYLYIFLIHFHRTWFMTSFKFRCWLPQIYRQHHLSCWNHWSVLKNACSIGSRLFYQWQ